MKKSFIMLFSILAFVFIAFIALFIIKISIYPSRIINDYSNYIQAKILILNSKELSKYFLYEARKNNIECLEFVEFNYPSKDDIFRIDYIYPLNKCENNKFKDDTKNDIIIINSSVVINYNKSVNEEIFLKESFFIYPKNY